MTTPSFRLKAATVMAVIMGMQTAAITMVGLLAAATGGTITKRDLPTVTGAGPPLSAAGSGGAAALVTPVGTAARRSTL